MDRIEHVQDLAHRMAHILGLKNSIDHVVDLVEIYELVDRAIGCTPISRLMYSLLNADRLRLSRLGYVLETQFRQHSRRYLEGGGRHIVREA